MDVQKYERQSRREEEEEEADDESVSSRSLLLLQSFCCAIAREKLHGIRDKAIIYYNIEVLVATVNLNE